MSGGGTALFGAQPEPSLMMTPVRGHAAAGERLGMACCSEAAEPSEPGSFETMRASISARVLSLGSSICVSSVRSGCDLTSPSAVLPDGGAERGADVGADDAARIAA